MKSDVELEKQAIELGCTQGHREGLVGVISNRLVEHINKAVVSSGGNPIKFYKDGKNDYLGYSYKKADCPNCIPFQGRYFCQNPVRIEQHLKGLNSKTSAN
jgi:hypothetical protein